MIGPVPLLVVIVSVPLLLNASAFLGGDLPVLDYAAQGPGSDAANSGILQIPDAFLRENVQHKRYLIFGSGTFGDAEIVGEKIRSVNSDSGFFLLVTLDEKDVPLLETRGYSVIPDFQIDLHSPSEEDAEEALEASRITEIASSSYANGELGYTGKGVSVAVIDTGVDFSNPDIQHSVARDKKNIPIMLDADGQGIILTNATFIANIKDGILRNYTDQRPDNITSTVYKTKNGVFLDVEQGGDGTTLSVYNSFFPQDGPEPVFNGTLDDDMKIGEDHRDYIVSKSGIYRLGVIYQGSLSGPLTGLQVVPVLVTDSETSGVYDTITPDLSTAWEDYTKSDLLRGERPDYDFDFTDEKPIKLGGGKEFLVYDHDDDGHFDFSAGTVGAQVVDVYGVIGEKKSLIDDVINAVNGTLLPPMDPGGRVFRGNDRLCGTRNIECRNNRVQGDSGIRHLQQHRQIPDKGRGAGCKDHPRQGPVVWRQRLCLPLGRGI